MRTLCTTPDYCLELLAWPYVAHCRLQSVNCVYTCNLIAARPRTHSVRWTTEYQEHIRHGPGIWDTNEASNIWWTQIKTVTSDGQESHTSVMSDSRSSAARPEITSPHFLFCVLLFSSIPLLPIAARSNSSSAWSQVSWESQEKSQRVIFKSLGS